MSNDETRLPQHHLESERAVLGSLMLTDKAFADVEPLLGKGDAFYRPAHATIYQALLDLRDRQEPTDPVSVAAHLGGDLSRVGGVAYLHDCMATTPTHMSAGHFARIVAACAGLRALEQRGRQITDAARTAHYSDADSLLERSRGWLADLTITTSTRTDALWIEAAARALEEMSEAADAPDGPAGLPTGLLDVDRVLEGLRPGNLIYVAARPRVGKSVFLLNVAQHVAHKLGKRVALFSLEMSESEVICRMLSAGTGVHLTKVRNPRDLADDEWAKLARYLGETEDASLHIDASPTSSLAQIRATCRRLIEEHGGLDLVVVDYLQLMPAPNPRVSRQEQVSEISRGLKLLAKEIGAPLIAACQLNRGPEQRSDKKPQLGDLRESGSLEQDSDVVVLLHREDADNPESPKAGECNVIIAKNRHGRQDTLVVAAQLHRSRFVSTAIP